MFIGDGDTAEQRLAEEIRYWKMQERENAAMLRSLYGYGWNPESDALAAWEQAFQATEATAGRWLSGDGCDGCGGCGRGPSCAVARAGELRTLTAEAEAQSRQWIAALNELSRRWGGIGPAAHMARDSEYFLGVLDGIAGAARGNGPALPEGSWSAASGASGATAALNAGGPGSAPTPVAREPVPIGGHTLPPLPYEYDALEPYIDAETIRIHHDILHRNYVEGLNAAERKLEEARRTGDFELVKHWERELAFNGAGHYLHTVYFFGMSPDGGGTPGGALARQIAADFGSFEAFKQHFSKAAEKVEGSGWAHLVWSPRALRLQILQAEKHQNLTQWDDVPLLSVDVWEHSYYLTYKNERARYVEAWFQVVNWPYVAERYEAASALQWKPY
ncbi:superoxide dismutase [Paenibacillus sp. TRM 82003]|nr:superoxide dismutase [Paenibacillus sp. TRM 82003]